MRKNLPSGTTNVWLSLLQPTPEYERQVCPLFWPRYSDSSSFIKCDGDSAFARNTKPFSTFTTSPGCTYDSFDEIAFFGSYSRCKYDDISSDRIWKSIAHLIHDDKFSITIFLACLSVCNSASMKCRLHRRANNLKWSENKRTYENTITNTNPKSIHTSIQLYLTRGSWRNGRLSAQKKIDKNCTKCNCQKQYKTNRDTQSVETKESYYDDGNQYIEKYLINRWKTTLIFVFQYLAKPKARIGGKRSASTE